MSGGRRYHSEKTPDPVGEGITAADDLVIDRSTWTIERIAILGSGRMDGRNDNEGRDKKEQAEVKGPSVYSATSTARP